MSTKVNTRIPKGKLKVGLKSSKGKGPVGEEWDEQPHGDPEDAPMLLKTEEGSGPDPSFRAAQKRFNQYILSPD